MQVVDAQNDLLLHYIHFKKYSSILKIKKIYYLWGSKTKAHDRGPGSPFH